MGFLQLVGVFTLLWIRFISGNATYKYTYHNVLLSHFAYKEFHLTLPCKALDSDSLRSGHLVFNLFCERRPFQVRITAPATPACEKRNATGESPKLYLNIRSHFLGGNEAIDFSDPLAPQKKRLTSASQAQLIEPGLQSYGQLLTSGSSALFEYIPPLASQPCGDRTSTSSGDEAKFLELEYVLVTPSIPANMDAYKFTNCAALNGFIPTGMLCDQYSDDRPLGCPLSVTRDSSDLDPAQGQDRQGLDCYPLVFPPERDDKTLKDIVQGVLVPASGALRYQPQLSFRIAVMVCLVFHWMYC